MNSTEVEKLLKDEVSRLRPDDRGQLAVNLFQVDSDRTLVGNRKAFELESGPPLPLEEEFVRCRAILDHVRAKSKAGSLSVISFRYGWKHLLAELEELSRDRTLVVLGGPDKGQNFTYILSDRTKLSQPKYSLSSDDISHHVSSADHIPVFCKPDDHSAPVRWAVLNCHDYTNPDLLCALLEKEVEVLVVVTDNGATQLFWEYAKSDAHRLFCYIVVVNTAELGGSAVYAPFRKLGRKPALGDDAAKMAMNERNAKYGANTVLFSTQGPGAVSTTVPLDMAALRKLRTDFETKGFAMLPSGSKDDRPGDEPVVPPQNYMDTIERPPETPAAKPRDIPTVWDHSKMRLAILQLPAMPNEAYTGTMYRLAGDRRCQTFSDLLREWLRLVEKQCRAAEPIREGAHLDMLLLPEVFVPREMQSVLQDFADHNKVIVVAGVDYPKGGEEENANECLILRPGLNPESYRKITRSQYDAMRDKPLAHPPKGADPERMHLARGTELIRFVDPATKRGFGVLICYDFSHLDLIRRLNLEDRENNPLELMVIVANNPYGTMYQSSCVADSHRFYQFVAMCNVAKYGGSGVFAPMRTKGRRQTLTEMGKGAEGVMIIDLPLQGLLDARQKSDAELHSGDFMRRPGIYQKPHG